MNKSVYLGILKEIVENIETRLHKICLILSERPFPKGKNKKNNLIDERWIRWTSQDKLCRIKIKKLKFENYKNCLEATQLENKINHLEKIKLT